MEAYVSLIGQLGFPIFVALYMLIKGSKDSELLRESVNELKIVITELTALVTRNGSGE